MKAWRWRIVRWLVPDAIRGPATEGVWIYYGKHDHHVWIATKTFQMDLNTVIPSYGDLEEHGFMLPPRGERGTFSGTLGS